MIGNESEHTIAAGILQRPARIIDVEGILELEHFTEPHPRGIYQVALRYHRNRGGSNSLDVALARSLLEQSENKAARSLLPTVEEYGRLETITEAEFRDAVERVRASRRKLLTKERATEALEAALAGDDAKARDLMRRGVLDLGTGEEDDRPVDLRSPTSFAEELRELKKPRSLNASLDIGFPFITQRAPVRPGMLTVLAGYTGDGKTQCAKTIAYNVAMRSSARVFYTSMEMSKREMRVLLLCAHAATIDPRGVPWSAILEKTATREEVRLYARAMQDFRVSEGAGDEPDSVRTKEGGTIYLWTPRRRPTMGEWCERVRIMHRESGVNVAVGDYLGLFRPTRRMGDRSEDLEEMAYEAKDAAHGDRDDDPGVWVLLLHQINREGRREAVKRSPRHYMIYDLKGSSGIEAAANAVWWVFSDEVLKSDMQARFGLAKVREGESLMEGLDIHFNPRIAVCGELQSK